MSETFDSNFRGMFIKELTVTFANFHIATYLTSEHDIQPMKTYNMKYHMILNLLPPSWSFLEDTSNSIC